MERQMLALPRDMAMECKIVLDVLKAFQIVGKKSCARKALLFLLIVMLLMTMAALKVKAR